jgi:hypothetical protein
MLTTINVNIHNDLIITALPFLAGKLPKNGV